MDLAFTVGISLLVGIISGLIASYVFLALFLDRKRPNIEISEWISKTVINEKENFLFKFVNLTEKEIFDVRVEATFYQPFGDLDGMNYRLKDIELKDNFIAYMPCQAKDDTHNLHCARIRAIDKLDTQWQNDSSFIRFTVIAKHSLTGLNKVFVRDFHHKNRITNKSFVSGNSLNVK